MYNLKWYQICHDLIAYFATLISPKKSQLGLIFRTGGSIYVLSKENVLFMLMKGFNKKMAQRYNVTVN